MGAADRLRATPLTRAEPAKRRSVIALAGVFFALGFVGASWISRIPQLQDALQLSNRALGLALVGLPLGSVAVSLILPGLLEQHARRIMLVGLPVAAASLLLLPLTAGVVELLLVLAIVGFTTAGVDVAMNAQAVVVQRRLDRPVIARWHAMWSGGGFVGAGAGAGFAAATTSLVPHFVIVLAAVLLSVPWLRRGLAPDPVEHSQGARRSWSTSPTVLVFAAVSVAAFAVEVCAADWGGVFLRRVLGTTVSTAAVAYAAFALPHFIARLCGDAVIARGSRAAVMGSGLLVAAVGFLVLVSSASPAQALAGLALSGAGVSVVVPVALLAAGNVTGVPSGAGVATVAGISYAGWSATPALVGAVAGAAGLRVALVIPMAAATAAALLVMAVGTSHRVTLE